MSSFRQNIKVRSPAKLNLTFDITGSLPGGYHEVETLMQAISLEDELEFEFDFSSDRFIVEIAEIEIDQIEIAEIDIAEIESYSALASVPNDANNLISKAAHLFHQQCATNEKCRISCKLKKRIPVAGGMGGGSGNAAATLVALDKAFDTRLSQEALSRLASQLGSDVPFFLSGGTQIGRNKGDVLAEVSDARPVWFVVVSPRGLSLATPQIYAEYDRHEAENPNGLIRPDLASALESLQFRTAAVLAATTKPAATEPAATKPAATKPAATAPMAIDLVQDLDIDHGFANVFSAMVFQKYPALKLLADEIASTTRKAVHMTGSGPTLFICAESEDAAAQLASLLHGPGDVDPGAQASRLLHDLDRGAQAPRQLQYVERLQASIYIASSIPNGVKVTSSTLAGV